MKIYKFRSVDDASSEWVDAILRTGEFRCSRFWEMNDPMEGVYRTDRSVTTDEMIRELFAEKSKYMICSFSGEKALKRPEMWGYYANGFKGLAIEVEIPRANVEVVTYTSSLERIDPADPPPLRVREILCNKLSAWAHEHEVRYLHDGDARYVRIGNIRSICLGLPFRNAENHADVESRFTKLEVYYRNAKKLIATAQDRGILLDQARLDGGKVQISRMDETFPE